MNKKTLVIDENLHRKLKKYCKKENIKINDFVSELLSNNIEVLNGKSSVLPLISKNTKNEVLETIFCSNISTEYSNNMPKSLTLLRHTKCGDGYIANYFQK